LNRTIIINIFIIRIAECLTKLCNFKTTLLEAGIISQFSYTYQT